MVTVVVQDTEAALVKSQSYMKFFNLDFLQISNRTMVHYNPHVTTGEEWKPVFDKRNWYPPTPASDSKLWRYRNLKRYTQILDNESLWFSRTDQFDDQYEGSLPDETYDRYRKRLNEIGFNYKGVFNQLRNLTYLNCWHKNSSESVAMWNLYLNNCRGVAIVSTPSRISEALQIDNREYLFGSVKYIDYANEDFNMNSITPFFYKRESFQHEREFRILFRDSEKVGFPEEGIKMKEVDDFLPEGIPVSVDLDVLIKEVRVSPVVDDSFYKKVKNETEERGYEYPITRSDLTGEQIF